MLASPQVATSGFALAAVGAWGTSDFLGGYFTRRVDAFLFTTIVNFGGLCLMLALVLATHAHFPNWHSVGWAVAGGASGGASLAVFYKALSSGKMGLTAPVSAVLSAAIPTAVSISTEGIPGKAPLAGFGLAAAGLWLITRAEDGAPPQGIGMAVFAGIGFAGFYLCIRQAGDASPVWLAALARCGGLIVTGAIVLLRRKIFPFAPADIPRGVLTGGIDSLGTILFVLSSQAGRLDDAVVISSLYPAVTVLLARIVLKERFTRWKFVGILAALAAVPMIAAG